MASQEEVDYDTEIYDEDEDDDDEEEDTEVDMETGQSWAHYVVPQVAPHISHAPGMEQDQQAMYAYHNQYMAAGMTDYNMMAANYYASAATTASTSNTDSKSKVPNTVHNLVSSGSSHAYPFVRNTIPSTTASNVPSLASKSSSIPMSKTDTSTSANKINQYTTVQTSTIPMLSMDTSRKHNAQVLTPGTLPNIGSNTAFKDQISTLPSPISSTILPVSALTPTATTFQVNAGVNKHTTTTSNAVPSQDQQYEAVQSNATHTQKMPSHVTHSQTMTSHVAHPQTTQSLTTHSQSFREKYNRGPYGEYLSKKKISQESTGMETKTSNKTSPEKMLFKITEARNELKNLRQTIRGLHSQHKKDVCRIEDVLHYTNTKQEDKHHKSVAADKLEDAAGIEKNKDANQRNGHDCSEEPRMDPLFQNWKPIGFMESPYMHKNGTPRQGCLVQESRGRIRILDALFNNPHHSLDGLDDYSHVWIIYLFDQNNGDSSNKTHTKAKVSPPRLGGAKLGVFATRSPHRPNPIGLTLAKLDAVKGSTVHVSGIDILFGTPILDIKPYIPEYDTPSQFVQANHVTRKDVMSVITNKMQDDKEENADCLNDSHEDIKKSKINGINREKDSIKTTPSKGIVITKLGSKSEYNHLLSQVVSLNTTPIDLTPTTKSIIPTSKQIHNARENDQYRNTQHRDDNDECDDFMRNSSNVVKTAAWLKSAAAEELEVVFNNIAEQQIKKFSRHTANSAYRLHYLSDCSELRSVIHSSARNNPRSQYRRVNCPDVLYYFTVDAAKVTAAFVEDGVVEVLRVVPNQKQSTP